MLPGMVISTLLVAWLLRVGGRSSTPSAPDKTAEAAAEVVAVNGEYIVIQKKKKKKD